MKLTEVKVFPVTAKNDLLAYADIIIDDCICVRDPKIRRQAIGCKTDMPRGKMKNGRYKDIAFALDYKTRKMIETAVLARYQKVTDKGREP